MSSGYIYDNNDTVEQDIIKCQPQYNTPTHLDLCSRGLLQGVFRFQPRGMGMTHGDSLDYFIIDVDACILRQFENCFWMYPFRKKLEEDHDYIG